MAQDLIILTNTHTHKQTQQESYLFTPGVGIPAAVNDWNILELQLVGAQIYTTHNITISSRETLELPQDVNTPHL